MENKGQTVMYHLACLGAVYLIVTISLSKACDESLCGSIVSKCQLLERCNCEVGVVNSTCSKECFKCLDYLYLECCSCVEICPKSDSTESTLSSQSHVDSLPEPDRNLFETLTEENDTLSRWTVYTRPVQVSFITGTGTQSTDITFGPGTKVSFKGDGLDREEDVQINCTVAYMSDCMPYNKCKSSCTSMGATAYRWFHDGCCECVGPNCINYGIDKSSCLHCPIRAHGEDDMVVDNPVSKTPSSKSDRSEDYEVAPAVTNEEEEEKQDINYEKKVEEDEKKGDKNVPESSTMI